MDEHYEEDRDFGDDEVEDFDDDNDEGDMNELEAEVQVLEGQDEQDPGDTFKNKRGFIKNKDRITSTFLTKYERILALPRLSLGEPGATARACSPRAQPAS